MERKKIVLVVEDDLSHHVCLRILSEAAPAIDIDRVVIAQGNGNIKRRLDVYERASRFITHLILTDLDRMQCVSELMQSWRVSKQTAMLFRVAVREVEAWLLADRAGFSDHFGIPFGKIPNDIESHADPKSLLLSLVSRSKSAITRGMNPEKGSYSLIGPLYNQRLVDFTREKWGLQDAAQASQSLNRMIRRLIQYADGI